MLIHSDARKPGDEESRGGEEEKPRHRATLSTEELRASGAAGDQEPERERVIESESE